MTAITTITAGAACCYCGHAGAAVPASLQPGTALLRCADRAACRVRQALRGLTPMTAGHVTACPACSVERDGAVIMCPSGKAIEDAARR
jgi:hypothetical protein